VDTQEPQEQVVKSVEELTAEVEKLTKELEFAKSENERVTRWWNDLERKKDELEEYLDENWDDLGDHAEKIAEIFEISTEVEKEVSVQISGSMTIKAPRSYDWDDLQYSSFTVSIEADWGADFTIEGYDLDVDRTDVD
jgi:predicted nuclease with TOPRIM domain